MFTATCYNPATKKTASSSVDDLEGAQTRARVLRTMEPLADRAKCKLQVRGGTKVWELRKVVGREFWKESDH